MSEPIWTPAPERVAASSLTLRGIRAARTTALRPELCALWRWSVEERERFWTAMMDFAADPAR